MTIIKLNIEAHVGTLTTLGGRIKNSSWRMTCKNGGVIKFPVRTTVTTLPDDVVTLPPVRKYRGRKVSVRSSWVSALQYSMKDSVLVVHCNQGSTYQYRDVAPSTWFHLQQIAEGGGSVGQFINSHVKGQYRSERVS